MDNNQNKLITIEQRIEGLERSFIRIEKMLITLIDNRANTAPSKWVTGKEAMVLLDLSTKSLQRLRDKSIIKSSTVSGRKIKYLRKDIEAYLEGKAILSSSVKRTQKDK